MNEKDQQAFDAAEQTARHDGIICGAPSAISFEKGWQAALEYRDAQAAAVQNPVVTVKYDLSPALVEEKIRSKLIELGWSQNCENKAEAVEIGDERINDIVANASIDANLSPSWALTNAALLKSFAHAVIQRTPPQPDRTSEQMPEWISYNAVTDLLTIHGKKYAASIFNDFFRANSGERFQIESKPEDEFVLLTRVSSNDEKERIAELEHELDHWRTMGQEPVAEVKENPYCPIGKSDEITKYLPVGTKLYTHQPTPPDVAELVEVEPLYYLQDTRSTVGNCPLWWREGGKGYTTDLREAHKYTFDEAMRQHKCRETDLPWPCDQIDAIQRITVDVQYMGSYSKQRAALASAKGAA